MGETRPQIAKNRLKKSDYYQEGGRDREMWDGEAEAMGPDKRARHWTDTDTGSE